MWLSDAPKVQVFDAMDRDRFLSEIVPAQQPAIFKGLVSHWPAVARAAQSDAALCSYLTGLANDRRIQLWTTKPELAGRYSFRDDLAGPNHMQRSLPFAEIANLLLRDAADENASCHYAGGVPVPQIMPGLTVDNPMPLLPAGPGQIVHLWIGNQTRTAAHWDLPQNLACVVAGQRRFTLFPIDQIDNLYITPLDLTLAGQPTSLVDFHNPDFARFPRFRDAMPHARVADLEPGDVLYMPSLWFHHVESLKRFGAMVNFWWRDGPQHVVQTTPLTTLFHALLTLRDLPEAERARWRTLFDHYIFKGDHALDHIPPEMRGMFGAMTPEIEAHIKAYVGQSLAPRR